MSNLLRSDKPAPSVYLHALRPHQWLKNTLVALPTVMAHDFQVGNLFVVLFAFVSFCLCASSIYIINDIVDLPYDKTHPEKRNRPLASGAIALGDARTLSAILAILSTISAVTISGRFFVVIMGYFSLSVIYSWYLKRMLMVDVVVLAMLYGIRVFGGAVATGIPLSHWLIGFCFFIFLCLALVKRTTEMIALASEDSSRIAGRAYVRTDLQTMTGLTAAAGFVSVLVLALYINSPEVVPLYRHPELLWGICVVLVGWLGRICLLTARGEMHDDPVVFAATDQASLLAGALIVAVFLLAL
jgi:4-hydroxybenzoate polyprenyltransferase